MNTTDGALVTDLTGDLRSAEKSIILTSGRQEARAAETSLRKIVVAMPFGRTALEKRKAILNFRRLKYIIEEKCQVIPSPTTGMRVAYDVDVARTIINEIPERALSEIYKADILIALLSERNFTVTYELGYRRGRERTPVMLMVDSEDDVSVYEAADAYLVWKQDDVVEESPALPTRISRRWSTFKEIYLPP
jgi:nucleoside 2-deoxyribosyltransferase